MTAKPRSNSDGLERVRVVLVHSRATSKTERYDEVTPGREREPVLRNLYVERELLKRLAAGAGLCGTPKVLEVTVRAVSAAELKVMRSDDIAE